MQRRTRLASSLAFALLTFAVLGGARAQGGPANERPERPVVELVFALDTTGSMGGLIAGAKQKIWSIVGEVAQGNPSPELRVGLVAYRDRGDAYTTQHVDLTSDMDQVFETLMGYTAAGGGDGPEDVNAALQVALERMSWTKGERVLRTVFLVGDAPPHMDYQDGVLYPELCKRARQRGIFLSAVRAGTDGDTERVWKHIAELGDGRYFAIEQSGGMVAVHSPYDDELGRLARELDDTRVVYGGKAKRDAVRRKKAAAARRAETLSASTAADRATFNAAKAAAPAEVDDDLVDAVASRGAGALAEVPAADLPEEVRALPPAARPGYIAGKKEQRSQIQARIRELSAKRSAHVRQELERQGHSPARSLDSNVVEAVREQMDSVF